MTRGDQRDRDRAKNQAKQLQKIKAQGREGNPLSRNLNDAAALAEKVAKKQAMLKEQEEAAQKAAELGPNKVERKKVPKKEDDGLDDLLNAGLANAKKK